MIRLLRRLLQSAAGTVVLTMLFFVLYYLYLWQVVDLRLIYHGGGSVLNFPVFYRGWEFFRQTVFWPGGLVGYISAFFAQFFSIGWAGPLIAAFQAWLIWLCIGSIVRISSGRRLRWVSFVAPILLLISIRRLCISAWHRDVASGGAGVCVFVYANNLKEKGDGFTGFSGLIDNSLCDWRRGVFIVCFGLRNL